MQSAKSEIEEKERELKSLKESFSEVMTKLKKDVKEDYNINYIGNIARRLMCFFFCEYAPFYETHSFGRKYNLSRGQRWEKSEIKSGFVDTGYYQIHNQEGNCVGFVCNKSEIMNAIYSDELFKMWCWYCEKKRFKESLATFTAQFKKNTDLFIEQYNDYLNRNHEYNHILEVINEPSIKIKNMVLCITQIENR